MYYEVVHSRHANGVVSIQDLASAMAQLHIQNLQTNFRGYLGQMALKQYYLDMFMYNEYISIICMNDMKTELYGYISLVYRRKYRVGMKYMFLKAISGICLLLHRDAVMESTPGATIDELQWEIRPVVVSKSQQGRGIGKELCRRMIDYGRQRNIARIGLFVHSNNVVAIGMYERLGFRKQCQHGDYITYTFEMDVL